MDENCNFSAVQSPIELKLSGDLELNSQISVHVLVSRFDCFSYCKQTNKQNAEIAKNAVFENLSFLFIIIMMKHGCIARGGHGLPKVSPGPAMLQPSRQSRQTTPETV
jgi:hypothetical protein